MREQDLKAVSDWRLEQKIEAAQSDVNSAVSQTGREIYQEKLDTLQAEQSSRERSK